MSEVEILREAVADAMESFRWLRDAAYAESDRERVRLHAQQGMDICTAALQIAELERCEACGGTDDVRYRGWFDEGSPMQTCSSCGAPDEERTDG